MLRTILCSLIVAFVTACASAPSVPDKRPLSVAAIERIGATDFVIVKDGDGLTKSWSLQENAGSQGKLGLTGLVVGTTVDAIANAGPGRRAKRWANEARKYISPDELDESLKAELETRSAGRDEGVRVRGVAILAKPDADTTFEGVVEISTDYVFSENGSVLKIVADASYRNVPVPYQSLYSRRGQGPLYRNRFTYISARVPIPPLEARGQNVLEEAIRASYADITGAPPAAGSRAETRMTAELERANDDLLTDEEAAILTGRIWLENDAARLKAELDRAHSFFATVILQDLNNLEVPSLYGADQIVSRDADGRYVRRIGATKDSGRYISEPGRIDNYTRYGNAIAIADPDR